ncbi:GD10531 [Drosophila simulans]|uniref:GD10531 n=1 Tax=Drosophila simulans TaxID=7240 RepID=B4QF87_DROSI|nr:GD10531 [Drosophila simulans]
MQQQPPPGNAQRVLAEIGVGNGKQTYSPRGDRRQQPVKHLKHPSAAWPLIGAVGDKLAASAVHLFAAGAAAPGHGTQTGARAGRVASRGAG